MDYTRRCYTSYSRRSVADAGLVVLSRNPALAERSQLSNRYIAALFYYERPSVSSRGSEASLVIDPAACECGLRTCPQANTTPHGAATLNAGGTLHRHQQTHASDAVLRHHSRAAIMPTPPVKTQRRFVSEVGPGSETRSFWGRIQS